MTFRPSPKTLIAPPLALSPFPSVLLIFAAVLFMNKDPVMVKFPSPEPLIAPPFPLAKLFLKMEFIIVTFPSLKNNPPPDLSTPPVELSSKILLVNVKLEFAFIFIAPPLIDDSLFPLKVIFEKETLRSGLLI